ncbi:hypothetical protein PoB_001300400 [Plakobranchus ocellatus]|uniref:Uncharacterized protein n=1 Tax=Plakobranchus ocellatus TaxID=259542 RepID=A0AAV3YXP7_9GAST|nr:hypothetical protein PoB_001300400 [Plakobranchus ocellatus]
MISHRLVFQVSVSPDLKLAQAVTFLRFLVDLELAFLALEETRVFLPSYRRPALQQVDKSEIVGMPNGKSTGIFRCKLTSYPLVSGPAAARKISDHQGSVLAPGPIPVPPQLAWTPCHQIPFEPLDSSWQGSRNPESRENRPTM